MLAIEVSASIFWARDSCRGRESIASTVSFALAIARMSSGFCAGQTKLTSVLPGFISAISSGVGARTLKIRSDPA
jgi:hypothetical protein